MKVNGRKPRSCLGQVFDYKLGCFDDVHVLIYVDARPRLLLKTLPRIGSFSLSFIHAYSVASPKACLGSTPFSTLASIRPIACLEDPEEYYLGTDINLQLVQSSSVMEKKVLSDWHLVSLLLHLSNQLKHE